jgi:predicted transcriptional regulator
MEPLLKTMEIFDKNGKFWGEHNLEVLPAELLLNIRDIGDYQIVENSDEEIFDINGFLNNISKAKNLKGISHTIHPRYPDFFLNFAKKGIPVSLILNPGVFKILKEKFPEQLQAGLNFKSSEVYVSKKDIKFSFIVTDSYFSISLFYTNGMFDSKHDVISYDPSAVAWGEQLFSFFQKESVKIENLD